MMAGNTVYVQGNYVDVHDNEVVNLSIDKASVNMQDEQGDTLPSKEQMCAAITETVKQGLWWSSRSWAVVYRVYQMKGYLSGFTQFVREASTWPVKTGFECNYDALQKPISSGVLTGNPERWEAQGGPRQAVKLAVALMEILDKSS